MYYGSKGGGRLFQQPEQESDREAPFSHAPCQPHLVYTPYNPYETGPNASGLIFPPGPGRSEEQGDRIASCVVGRRRSLGVVEARSTPDHPDERDVAPKMTQKADRSCKVCRQRRVRCGREYPTCSRCKKRKDDCGYGDDVSVEDVIEGSDQQKVAALERQIASLEHRLRKAEGLPTSRSATIASTSTLRDHDAFPSETSRRTLAASIAQSVPPSLPAAEASALASLVLGESFGLSFGGAEESLSSSTFQRAFTCFLLDAAVLACDTRLAAFSAISSRLPYYKTHLETLDPASQVSVAVLCALGARTTSQPAAFGLPTVLAADGTPDPALFQLAGARREHMCKQLERRARETAWEAGLFAPDNMNDLEALVGLMGLSLHEENNARSARFLIRTTAGAFLDLRQAELESSAASSASQRIALAVLMSDAVHSVHAGAHNLISATALTDYIISAGVDMPDLANPDLLAAVEHRNLASQSWYAVSALLDKVFLYVMSCCRVFNQVLLPRRTTPASALAFLRSLWSLLDQVHNAIQRLQQHLVTSPPTNNNTSHLVDHSILLAVRADDMLVGLIMQIHAFLTREGGGSLEVGTDAELDRMRGESQLRVMKCLRLLAFYCQLHCSSQDKHNVFHLFMQLNTVLPGWPALVHSQLGEATGPENEEFALTDDERDWFRQALELSTFYTSRTLPMLEALSAAQQRPVQHIHTPSGASPHEPLPPTRPSSSHLSGSVTERQQPATDYLPRAADTSAPNYTPAFSPTPDHPSFYTSIPFPLAASGKEGFADGAGQNLTNDSADVRDAFRSVDWSDLSLTPAAGSDDSHCSLEEWM
ncbi:hypothetical protein JCM11641_008315 [Rhodosporidiobolus odoratus]